MILLIRNVKLRATILEAVITKYGLSHYPADSTCEKATILEENVRLTKELAKFITSKNKMSLDDLLTKQRSNNKKHGLGYAPYAKKNNNKKNEKPTQAKNKRSLVVTKFQRAMSVTMTTRD